MDASIIIVSWNTRRILLKCLESLAQCQIKCRTEVIVVDNGSEDGSQGAVRRRFPNAKLIENRANLGFAKANNIGIKEATGKYLCLINSDVKVREECIDRLVRYMDANAGIGMVGPKILNPDLTVQDSCRRFPSLWTNLVVAVGLDKLFPKSRVFYGEHMLFFSHDKVLDLDYIAGCFMLVRRETIDQIGLMDERFFIYQEEVDWCKRFWEGGWRISFFPGAEAIHHHGASSSRDPLRFALAQQRSVLLYWEKYYNFVERVTLICILSLRFASRLLIGYTLIFLWPGWRDELKERIAENKALFLSLFRRVTA
jgi:GT2 family glycosyltransferase